MNNINYMAIDPSKRSTGIFIKSGKEILLFSIIQKVTEKEKYTYISKKGKDKGKQKTGFREIQEPAKVTINRIYETVKMLINQYKIDLVFIENNPFSGFKKSQSPSKMAEVIGVIKLACKDVEIIELSNALWKGFFKGYPFINTKKNKKYIEQAEKYLKRKFNTCDEVDAFLIGCFFYNLYKRYPFTDAQAKMRKRIISVCNEIEVKKIF